MLCEGQFRWWVSQLSQKMSFYAAPTNDPRLYPTFRIHTILVVHSSGGLCHVRDILVHSVGGCGAAHVLGTVV